MDQYHAILQSIIKIIEIPLATIIFFIHIQISKTRKATLVLKQKPKRLLRFSFFVPILISLSVKRSFSFNHLLIDSSG